MTITSRPSQTHPDDAEPPDHPPAEPHKLSVLGGLAALSLDAMASVAYGPEAIVLVLAIAGGAGLGFTLPVTAAIAALLVVLTVSYRQVIAAFPDGGGAYGVAKRHLGRWPSLVAGASLIVDYVLNVAVSVAAGVAALTSAFPQLLPYTVWLCLGVLAVITAINLRGIAHSARAFILPAIVYVDAVVAVILVGLLRGGPAVTPEVAAQQAATVHTVGLLLLLKAFANGCASLTGVEAIANAVPSFRRPRVRRAQYAELVLGGLLAVMLLGIAALIEKFGIHPVSGVTVTLLALAANTSFGGPLVLAQLLAEDNNLPHLFALRAERSVHRYGIGFLAVISALLLVITNGQMNLLVPLFAIGVFTLSQVGMVRHWLLDRPSGWTGKAALNEFGALLTGVAAVVVTVSKFDEGGWLIVIALPVLIGVMEVVNRDYRRIGTRLELGVLPSPPRPSGSMVVVPVTAVSRLTRDAVAAALSMGGQVIAVHVTYDDEDNTFLNAWDEWNPGVPLVRLHDDRRRLADPLVEYLHAVRGLRVFVLIPEVEPEHLWQRVLQNHRGTVLARALRRRTDVVVCRQRFRLG